MSWDMHLQAIYRNQTLGIQLECTDKGKPRRQSTWPGNLCRQNHQCVCKLSTTTAAQSYDSQIHILLESFSWGNNYMYYDKNQKSPEKLPTIWPNLIINHCTQQTYNSRLVLPHHPCFQTELTPIIPRLLKVMVKYRVSYVNYARLPDLPLSTPVPI